MRKQVLFGVLICLVGITVFAQVSLIRGPSGFLSGRSSDYTLMFVFDQLPDLRGLFCDASVTAERTKKSVCLVDSRLVASLRREIPVDSSTTVAVMLEKMGLTNWNGTQPQVRLITRDALFQSSFGLLGKDKERATSEFRQRRVGPGDIVVLADSEL